ncbi:MAG: HEAT repeat domain-containing protein [Bacteroidetes bacterium]|nr:MAG: HEAT repeat domain-containing protein [Bacteroidota bacterium]
MKRIIIRVFLLAVFVIITGFVGLYAWGEYSLRQNIKKAKEKYGGKAEDALIAYLLDESNSPWDRSHLAINTLGQIKSEKAIPILKQLYKNDPEGKTCKGHHDKVLCQYEIYKALNAAEVNWLPLHAHLNH